MSVTVENRRNRLGNALAALLTILLLVPVGILFVQVWNAAEADRAAARMERQGVEYLTRLTPLVTVLAESQASALQGVSAPPAALEQAVADVADADRRLGAALGTRERWAGLRDGIAGLSTAGTGAAAFQAHVEVTSLLLALHNAVRDNSQLARDPDSDVAHLQEAAAVGLPTAVTQATRMADLSLLVPRADDTARRLLAPQFGAAVLSVDSTVNALTDSLQAAVDDTGSRTLSSSLISPLDAFRRGIEELQRGANPTGQPDAAALATARSRLTQTTTGLATPILQEMDGLLRARLDAIAERQRNAAVTATGAGLLAFLALVIPPLVRRRRRPPDGSDVRRPAVVDSGHVASLHDPESAYGDEVSPTRRERSGALR